MSRDPGVFSVGHHDHDGRAVFVPRGELDLATAAQLEEPVLAALDEGRSVVIDLRELAFMDSSGVRVLIAAHGRAGDGGVRLALVRPPDGGPVARILEIAGVGQALRLVEGLEPPDR